MPRQVNKSAYVGEVLSALEAFNSQVSRVLGGTTSETTRNKTAEEVLSNRENKEASRNLYMKNAKNSLKELGRVIVELSYISFAADRMMPDGSIMPAIQSIDGVTVQITDGPIEANKRLKALQQTIAFQDLAMKAGLANVGQAVMPEILMLSDLDEDQKDRIAQKMFMNRPDPMVVQLQAQLQQSQAYVTKLEAILQAEGQKTASQMAMNEADNLTKLRIEAMKQEGAQEEIAMKAIIDQEKRLDEADIKLAEAAASSPTIIVDPSASGSQYGRRL